MGDQLGMGWSDGAGCVVGYRLDRKVGSQWGTEWGQRGGERGYGRSVGCGMDRQAQQGMNHLIYRSH